MTGIEAWSCDGEEVGQVGVYYGGEVPHIITLEYQVRRPEEDGDTIRERVGLDRTRCPFGGSRPWLVCPGCGTRRAVLFCVGGLFRCRVCHDLAYRSTRESLAPAGKQPRFGSSNDIPEQAAIRSRDPLQPSRRGRERSHGLGVPFR